MRTTIEMAREAAGDDWGLFQEYMPEIHRLAELVRADERARMAEQPARQKPVAKAMTAHRAAYFMERFKHEEKLLGPNEQAALDFVIAMLEAQPQQEPVATWLGTDYEAHKQCFAQLSHLEPGTDLYTTPPAQPAPTVQEPVAWMDGYRNIYSLEEKAAGCEDALIPLVPAIQHWSDCAIHNEPAYPKSDCDCGGYTTPPAAQKSWIGLTDEEILEVLCIHVEESDDPDEWAYEIQEARAIEAKLKEKNNG